MSATDLDTYGLIADQAGAEAILSYSDDVAAESPDVQGTMAHAARQYEPFNAAITTGVNVQFTATETPQRWVIWLTGGVPGDSVRVTLGQYDDGASPILSPGSTLVLPGRTEYLTVGGVLITGTVRVVALAVSNVDAGHAGSRGTVAIAGYLPAVYTTITRPDDTNAYAANDAIANATSGATLASAALGRTATGTGLIVGLTLQNGNAAATHRVELDLYNASITAKNDNAEATRLAADKLKFIGTITLPALAKKTANSDQTEASDFTIRVPFQCAGSSLIYFVVRTLDAHTPASGTTYTFCFHIAQN